MRKACISFTRRHGYVRRKGDKRAHKIKTTAGLVCNLCYHAQ